MNERCLQQIFKATTLKIVGMSGEFDGDEDFTRTRLCLLNECVDKESADPEDAK